MISENTIHSHKKAVDDINRMLNNRSRLQSKIDSAVNGSIADGKVYVVVDLGGRHYQVWNKSIAEDKKMGWIYCTDGSVSDDKRSKTAGD